MTLHIKLNQLAAAIVVGALLVGGGYALASTGGGVISACIQKKTRQLSIPASAHCAKGYAAISWNQRGIRGVAGARGATGERGAAGTAGLSASVSIGTVTTGAAGSLGQSHQLRYGQQRRPELLDPTGRRRAERRAWGGHGADGVWSDLDG